MSSLLPSSNLSNITVSSESDTTSTTWNLNNTNSKLTGLDAIKQSVIIMLSVSRYEHLIYSWNYGQELHNLIGNNQDFVETESQRLIKECLLQDERISNVSSFTFTDTDDELLIKFNVTSTEGTFESEVSI